MAKYEKTHGMKGTREYSIWGTMKKRCLKQNMPSYKYYGAKGITVCDKWLKFEGFFEDMGFSNGLCLDRIDTSKGYYKENCRWVTYKENNRNKSNNFLIEGKTCAEWSEISGLSPQVIHYRIHKLKMNPIEAVSMPLMRKAA
jgi:hypothetical protein